MTPWERWGDLCEKARCSPDTILTDEQFASRLLAWGKEVVEPDEIRVIRTEARVYLNMRPTHHVATMRVDIPAD